MLKLNVSVSKKISDNNFGSRGASVGLEVELDSNLLQEPERAQERVRQLFRLAQQSVDDELTRQNPAGDGFNGRTPAANGNGQHRPNGRKATASQVRAIHSIVNRQGLDLVQTLRERGVEHAEDLSITEASGLIDDLKAHQANGSGGRR